MVWRTIHGGKLRSLLPDAWETAAKTRFIREIREECNILTALHEAGTLLIQHALELAVDNFLLDHGFLLEGHAALQELPHLQGMPEIRLSFNLPPLHIPPPIQLNRQDLVFTMPALGGPQPMSPLTDHHGTTCRQALSTIIGIGGIQQPAFLPSVWNQLLRPHIHQENSKLGHFIDMARRGQDRRRKAYGYSISLHLAPQMQGNMKAMIPSTLERHLKTCFQSLARHYLALPVQVREALVERTVAFMSPRHIKLAEIIGQDHQPVLPLNVAHPMFQHLPQGGLPPQLR